MMVEIHGAGFANKGAELMLHTVLGELRSRLPLFTAAIDPTYGPYHLRTGLGLHQMYPPRSHVGTPGFGLRFSRQKLFASLLMNKIQNVLTGWRHLYGCVNLSEIIAFLDIAGFAYTDEWGSRPTQDLALLTAYYKARGVPVILLPQAFGPFKIDETRSAFLKVLNHATLVFARDQQSYEYVAELAPDPRKIHLAQDITLFYPRAPLWQKASESGYVCVVPNIRILDRGQNAWGARYHNYLSQVIQKLVGRGLSVRVVVHDATGEDLQLAQRLCAEAGSSAVSLWCEEDPIALKQLIGGGMIIIGSRYHSLVAALSYRVPAVAIGWSHKYNMLFQDFGLDNFIFSSPQAPIEALLSNIDTLLDPDTNTAFRQKIDQRLQKMEATNEEMWTLITDTLKPLFPKPQG
jgi:polysaccharide pyruvyl transferase WcaK-like protein